MTRSGQIMIIVLLLAMMSLTVGLATASRSLSDLKQITYVGAGTKAYAAAEAALQYGLNQVTLGSYTIASNCAAASDIPISQSLIKIDGIQSLSYRICTNNSDFAMMSVSQDGVFELPLEDVRMDVKYFDLVWSDPGAALEAIIIRQDSTLERYVINGMDTKGLDNGFLDGAVAASGCDEIGGNADPKCVNGAFTGGSCYRGIEHSSNDKLIRVKPLYRSSTVAICTLQTDQSTHIGLNQNIILDIIVTAKTDNNTVRRLKTTKMPPSLPAIFDYAIYSNGQITKQ